MPEPTRWHIDLPGTRVDEFPWRIHAHELDGGGGPATCILAGMIGDKPLGVLTLHKLIATLRPLPLKGKVIVIPCVNPFGFQGSTRHNPDLVELNRRFPGSPIPTGNYYSPFAWRKEITGLILAAPLVFWNIDKN